jgi:hypothetical protein
MLLVHYRSDFMLGSRILLSGTLISLANVEFQVDLIDITAPNTRRYPSKTTLTQFNDRNPWFGEVFSFHIRTLDEIKSGNLRVMFTLKDFISGHEAGRVSLGFRV